MDTLTMEQFLKYQPLYLEVPEELKSFVTRIEKIKPPNDNYEAKNWRKNKLNKSWVTTKKINQSCDDKLCSEFRGILNKLSDNTFDELVAELKSLNITTKSQLETLSETIFKKAITEGKFSELYARLSFNLRGCVIEVGSNKVYFRELLLNRCQEMFEKCTGFEHEDDLEQSLDFRFKEEILGCISFIGELYNYELLTTAVIYNCFQIMIMKIKNKKAFATECSCRLMDTVGKTFCKKSPEKAKLCFGKFDEIKNNKQLVNMKEKFAIMDILEKRDDEKWMNE